MASSTEPALEFSSVTKRYGDHTVLDALDLRVDPLEKVAIIGPSGSGKTTVLRAAMALEPIDSGRITVFGGSYWDGRRRSARGLRRHLEAVRRPVGMVFQAYNLFPHLTVMQNMLEAPIARGMGTREEIEQRAKGMLEAVGLGSKADTRPGTLSGGQQQRVALARALLLEPRLLLLDEITSALDPELVSEVLRVVSEVAARSACALLLVTHEMRFARGIADRVVVMEGGAIVEQGPPEQVFGDPRSERTRRFLDAVDR